MLYLNKANYLIMKPCWNCQVANTTDFVDAKFSPVAAVPVFGLSHNSQLQQTKQDRLYRHHSLKFNWAISKPKIERANAKRKFWKLGAGGGMSSKCVTRSLGARLNIWRTVKASTSRPIVTLKRQCATLKLYFIMYTKQHFVLLYFYDTLRQLNDLEQYSRLENEGILY